MNRPATGKARKQKTTRTSEQVRTTLYELISTVSDEAGPEGEALVVATVEQISLSGKIKGSNRMSERA